MVAFTLVQTDWVQDAEPLARVRRAVFIEEQGVPESLEWDADDARALHWLARSIEGAPIGCARLLPDGRLGRMAVVAGWRGCGVGRALLDAAVAAACGREMPELRLSAQVHATAFYIAAGFVTDGPGYEEAGIPHVPMHKSLR